MQYAALGWKIFPCHGITDEAKCTSGLSIKETSDLGKRPATSRGQNDCTSDPETIKRWWHTQPHYNIGVNCKASGFFVIDVDPRHGGDESFRKLLELLGTELPVTVEAITGKYTVDGKDVRGRHFYFLCDTSENLVGNLEKLGLPGIDIKFNGYVIVPPSRHFSGVEYAWVAGHEPWSMPIAEAPEFLLNKLRKATEVARSLKSASFTESQSISRTSGSRTAHEELMDRCEQVRQLKGGKRNSGLNGAAYSMGRLIGGGEISLDEVLRELTAAARAVFTEDSAESEIATILRISGGALEAGATKPRYLSKGQLEDESGQIINLAALSDDEYLKHFNKLDWVNLWADKTVEEWLVPGIICEARGHTWYSEPGIGKSLMIREMCACLATGKSVFGFPSLEPMSILYIDHENIPTTDIKRSLIDMGFTAEELEKNLHLFSFPEFSPFDTQSGGRELRRLLDILKPRLVVIDTASRTIVGKENENDTWIKFYNYTGKLLKTKKIAYIRIDHTGKNVEAGPRGGSSKMGDIDLVWYLKQVAKEKTFRIINKKHRVPIPEDVYEITRELEPLRHVIVSSVPLGEYYEMVLEFERVIKLIKDFISKNPAHPTGIKALWEAMREECKAMGVSRKTFDEARQSILEGLFEEEE